MTGTGAETENWVRERAECIATGFLRKLRSHIWQDALEANNQFRPDKSFSLSDQDEPDIHVYRSLKGREEHDAFVLFRPTGPNAIAATYHRRNGNPRNLYTEEPLGEIALEWDHDRHSCTISLGGKEHSLVDLRRATLGKLFFGD